MNYHAIKKNLEKHKAWEKEETLRDSIFNTVLLQRYCLGNFFVFFSSFYANLNITEHQVRLYLLSAFSCACSLSLSVLSDLCRHGEEQVLFISVGTSRGNFISNIIWTDHIIDQDTPHYIPGQTTLYTSH